MEAPIVGPHARELVWSVKSPLEAYIRSFFGISEPYDARIVTEPADKRRLWITKGMYVSHIGLSSALRPRMPFRTTTQSHRRSPLGWLFFRFLQQRIVKFTGRLIGRVEREGNSVLRESQFQAALILEHKA